MRKSFFFSIIALAAVVSCNKSEIVDTKFNEEIGFEAYAGRDAMTKAAVADEDFLKANKFGVFGFYTGKDSYSVATPANLMDNIEVRWGVPTNVEDATTESWWYDQTKYWTNDTDKYTFFAYSPKSLTATKAEDAAPSVAFQVNPSIPDQTEFLYSNNLLNTTKVKGAKLTFKHALSRITVKASENVTEYDYNIKAISISGEFNTTGNLNLCDEIQTVESSDVAVVKWTPTPAQITYTIASDVDVKLTDDKEASNFAKRTVEGVAKTDNYLMIIPTDFSKKTSDAADAPYAKTATLTVTYTTTFGGYESEPMTRTLPVNTNFEMGKAYSLNLAFEPNTDNAIVFTVEVADWGTENDVPVGNPEEGDEA